MIDPIGYTGPAHAARAELVTPPEFGCVQFEAKP